MMSATARRPWNRAAARRRRSPLRYSGTAIFRGVCQERDVNPHFLVDFPNMLMTITDEQGTPKGRLKLGRFTGGNDWGLSLYNELGTEMFRARGDTPLWAAALRIGGIGSTTGLVLSGSQLQYWNGSWSGSPNKYVEAVFDPTGLDLFSYGSGGRIKLDAGLADSGYPLFIKSKIALRAQTTELDDGSTNTAQIAGIVVSTSPASGDYPENTVWFRVPA